MCASIAFLIFWAFIINSLYTHSFKTPYYIAQNNAPYYIAQNNASYYIARIHLNKHMCASIAFLIFWAFIINSLSPNA